MLAELHKYLDRVLTLPRRDRPATEAYWQLFTASERVFAQSLISLLASQIHPDFRLAVTLMGSTSRYYDHHLLRKIGFPPRQPLDIDLMVTIDPHSSVKHSLAFKEQGYQELNVVICQLLLDENMTFTKNISPSPFTDQITNAVQYLTDEVPDRQLRSFDVVFFHLFEKYSTWQADRVAQKYRTAGVRLFDNRDPAAVQSTYQQLDEQQRVQEEMANMYLNT